uniref:Uncharacterized protein n=1 Tax=Arundo donax TaxID=35708 RepID=A0A0A9HQ86_ARUDO
MESYKRHIPGKKLNCLHH